MAHYVDLTNKEWSHGDPWDWSHYPGNFLFSLLAPTFSRLRHHRIPDLSLCDHKTLAADWKLTTPSENFPLEGYKKNPVRKGGNWFFSKVSHPLVFPLINFLFLPDNLAHSLFLHTCLIFWCQNPGGKIHHDWVGSSYEPTPGGPLPWTLQRNWDNPLRMGLSTCLAGLTSTHQPTFHPSVIRVSEIDPLRSSPCFQVLALGGRIPWPSGPWPCAPVWL